MFSHRAPGFAAKRTAIRLAATRLFAELGYQRASILRLAQSLGITANGVTNYFYRKEDVLFAILEAHLGDLLAALECAEPAAAPARDRLAALARAYMDFIAGAGADGHRLLQEAARFLPPARQQDLRARQRWLLELFIAPLGEVAGARASPLALSLLALLNGQATWLRPEGALGRADYAALAVSCVLAGASGGSAPAQPTPAQPAPAPAAQGQEAEQRGAEQAGACRLGNNDITEQALPLAVDPGIEIERIGIYPGGAGEIEFEPPGEVVFQGRTIRPRQHAEECPRARVERVDHATAKLTDQEIIAELAKMTRRHGERVNDAIARGDDRPTSAPDLRIENTAPA